MSQPFVHDNEGPQDELPPAYRVAALNERVARLSGNLARQGPRPGGAMLVFAWGCALLGLAMLAGGVAMTVEMPGVAIGGISVSVIGFMFVVLANVGLMPAPSSAPDSTGPTAPAPAASHDSRYAMAPPEMPGASLHQQVELLAARVDQLAGQLQRHGSFRLLHVVAFAWCTVLVSAALCLGGLYLVATSGPGHVVGGVLAIVLGGVCTWDSSGMFKAARKLPHY